MQRYLVRRLIFSIFAIWAVMTLTFFFMRALPGDPITVLAGEEADFETIALITERLGLDRPIHVQYAFYVKAMLSLDMGDSITRRLPVMELVREALPRTLSLAWLAFVIAVGIGVPAGIISAIRRYSVWDHLATTIAFMGLAMPTFWLGIILIIVFAVMIDLLPVFGFVSIHDSQGWHIWQWFIHLVLPAVATGAGSAAILARQTRSAMLETLSQDYIRTAYAKGLRERVVIWRHAFRNSLIPVVTVMGIILALLLNGVVIVENVFAFRGLGRMLVESILGRDYPIVQAVILLIAFIFISANLAVDVLYAFINPRIRYTD